MSFGDLLDSIVLEEGSSIESSSVGELFGEISISTSFPSVNQRKAYLEEGLRTEGGVGGNFDSESVGEGNHRLLSKVTASVKLSKFDITLKKVHR